MSMLSLTMQSRLEKAAVDNGFDHHLSQTGAWLSFKSSHCNLQIWLTQMDNTLVLAFARTDIATELADLTTIEDLPAGASCATVAENFEVLGTLIRRSFQLARTLPNALANAHETATAGLPLDTEVERLVVQRIGQGLFRRGLLDFWDAKCAVTGLDVVEVLRASHIKPWAVCNSDSERLNIYNGLLLSPHLDALFDRGLISFSDAGDIQISGELNASAREVLSLSGSMKLRIVSNGHRHYLAWHRLNLWRR